MKKIKYIVIIIFLIYLCTYILATNGYSEYTKKSIITNEKIKEFESAIKEDKNIDELEFFKEDEVDYTNKFSNIMYEVSNKGSNIFRKYIKKVFGLISSLMEE